MKLCCLLEVSLELQEPGFPRGMSRGCVIKVYAGVAVFGAVPAAGVHGLFQYGSNDSTLVGAWGVHVRRVDPPVGEDGTMTVACF